jgi:prepilin peptidase CpaA
MLTGTAALVFLPFVLPIAIWVAWSDMKFMKIPNKAVIALGIVFLFGGLALLPFYDWLWALALFAIVLVVGFVLSSVGMVGAGDAKFAAVMAPFFVGADVRLVLLLAAACLIGAFVGHRAMKRVPAFRAATPDWLSWTHRQFPMGLALSGVLIIYLATVVWSDFAD